MAKQSTQQMPPDDGGDGQGGTDKERKLYETLLAGLLDFMWGKGQADIQRQIQSATPDTLATVIGHITFALVQQGADQAEQAGHELTADMLMGVATEVIESLEKMAAAMNMQFDAQAVALQALTQTLNDYAESLPQGSDAQAEAKQALAQFGQGTINDAAQTVQSIGARNGAAPFQPAGAPSPDDSQGAPPPANAQATGLMGAAS